MNYRSLCTAALLVVVAASVAHALDSASERYRCVVERDGDVLRQRVATCRALRALATPSAEYNALVDSLSTHIHRGRPQVVTDFTDSSQRIEVPADPRLDYRDAFSYSLWLWLDAETMLPQTKILSHAGVVTGKVTVMGEGRRLVVLTRYDDGSEAMVRTRSGIAARRWVHVGVAFEHGVTSVTIDGEPAGVRSIRGEVQDRPLISLPEQPLYIGGFDRAFPGRIDDVRLYARALSAAEFAALFRGDDVAGGRIAWWPLDETSGGVAHDAAGGGLDGVVGDGVSVALPGRRGTAMGFGREGTAWTQRLRDLEARCEVLRAGVTSAPVGEAPALDRLRALLRTHDAVLVHYEAGADDSVTAWIVDPRASAAVTPVPLRAGESFRSARSELLDELARTARDGRDDVRARRAGREVAAALWDSIEDRVGTKREVWLRLTPGTRAIPFSCLVDRDGRYLVERYAFARCGPVAELVQRAADRDDESTPSRMVVFADPDFAAIGDHHTRRPPGAEGASRARRETDAGCVTEGAALPGTQREARAVAELAGRRGVAQIDVREWDVAQEHQLDRDVPGADVVHVATHGYRVDLDCLPAPPADPLFLSGVVLAGAMRMLPDGYRGSDEGLLSAAEVAHLDLASARLVVWSACATATGSVLPDEPLCGLSAAVWLAGAGASVATLWDVSDETMPLLIETFYDGWLGGKSPAQALRAALLRGMEAGVVHGTPHPADWAALVVEGL